MAQLALQSELEGMFVAPPKRDWAAAIASRPTADIDDDLRRLAHIVNEGEASMARWRTSTSTKMRSGLTRLETLAKGELPSDVVAAINTILPIVEEAILTFSIPLHEAPDAASSIKLILKLAEPNAARFIRKQLRRIEKMRVNQHNACVDAYYTLVAFRSEYEADNDAEVFNDPIKLAASLRRSLA